MEVQVLSSAPNKTSLSWAFLFSKPINLEPPLLLPKQKVELVPIGTLTPKSSHPHQTKDITMVVFFSFLKIYNLEPPLLLPKQKVELVPIGTLTPKSSHPHQTK